MTNADEHTEVFHSSSLNKRKHDADNEIIWRAYEWMGHETF